MLPLVKRLPVDRGEVHEQRQVGVSEWYDCEVVVVVLLWRRNSSRSPVESELRGVYTSQLS